MPGKDEVEEGCNSVHENSGVFLTTVRDVYERLPYIHPVIFLHKSANFFVTSSANIVSRPGVRPDVVSALRFFAVCLQHFITLATFNWSLRGVFACFFCNPL